METKLAINKFYSICEWCMKMILLNLLWLTFSLGGLIIFGFFPATVAMFAVTRKWVQKTEQINFFKVFLSSFKKEFWKANLIGLILFLIATALYLDLLFIQSFDGRLAFYSFCLIIMVCLFCFVIALFLLTLYVHIELPFIQYFKQSILIFLSYPLDTIIMVGSVLLITFFFLIFPGLILFMAGSLISLIVTINAHRTFRKLSFQTLEY
ncbi:YesL family protein [Pseudalkalibacillus sp. A8]|uniref:YesL family protein n=1 Tax=Pseudalkalibacillus sp. A8 TaxID=3382641 RepID=UPI0038B4D8D6